MERANTTTMEPEGPSPEAGRELVRPTEGRMLAGVSQGLANRFGIPVLLVRFLFVVLTFGGGTGIALYAAGWFLMRSEDESEAPAERFFSEASGLRSWIGVALVLIAALVLLDSLTFLSGGVIWAVALLVVGLLLYSGDLPRLISPRNDRADSPETETARQPEEPTPEAPSGGSSDAGGAPPPPSPTPPILPPSAAKPKERSYLGRLTIGFALLALGVLAVFDNTTNLVQPEPRHYMAMAVTIFGLGLLVGAFAGRARWLILLGLIMIPTLLLSPVFEYDWTSETFDRRVVPTSFEEVDQSYEMDVGSLVIDLTALPWDGRTIELSASVDAGNLEVLVPHDVGLTGSASVDVGRVASGGRRSAGLSDPRMTFDDPDSPLGRIHLDLTVDVGNIDIHRVPPS